MSRFLETIRIQNGVASNLSYHNLRLNETRRRFFKTQDTINLKDLIPIPESLQPRVVRCRIIYSREIESITLEPYAPTIVRSLQIIYNDAIDYAYKYADRRALDALKQDLRADDIIIVKNGYVTDASYANLVFYDGTMWFTPSTPLLKGTYRAYLLDKGVIHEREITVGDFKYFKSVKRINAMLEWNSPVISIDNIIYK